MQCAACRKYNCKNYVDTVEEYSRRESSREVVNPNAVFEGIPAGPGFRQGILFEDYAKVYYNCVGTWNIPYSNEKTNIGVRWDHHTGMWDIVAQGWNRNMAKPGELKLRLKEMYGLTFI